jgi:hypothetical protein
MSRGTGVGFDGTALFYAGQAERSPGLFDACTVVLDILVPIIAQETPITNPIDVCIPLLHLPG